MDKNTAKETLEMLQKTIAEAQQQAKELQDIINSADVPDTYDKVVLREEAIAHTSAVLYADGQVSNQIGSGDIKKTRVELGSVFVSKDAAEERKRFLMLRQKARVAMAKAWENKPKPSFSSSTNDTKYCVVYVSDMIEIRGYSGFYYPFHFPTCELAKQFIADLGEANVKFLLTNM